MPFFSVIIPTYNRSAQLMTAIHSVLSQDFYDFEVIVVDDGSTDDTETKVRGIQDERIRYFKKENEERNIARNYGIDRSNGDYINFLDSDDLFYSHHFSTAANFLATNNYPGIVHLSYEHKDENDQVFCQRILSENSQKELINENLWHGNAIFIRRNILKEFRFLPSKNAIVGEDHYLWLRLATRYDVQFCSETTCVVKEHSQRSLKDIDINKLVKGTEEIVSGLLSDKVFQKKYKKSISNFIGNKYGLIATACASSNRKDLAIKYIWKAFRLSPKSIFSTRVLAALKHLIFT